MHKGDDKRLAKISNPLTTNVPYHIETSQLTGFHIIGNIGRLWVNKHYAKIVEWSSVLQPKKIVCRSENFNEKIVLHNIIKMYENHSSIIKIKNNMPAKSYLSSLPSARQIISIEVNLILKYLKTKKASGTDKIPPKLAKSKSEFLSTPLAIAFNNSLASSKFPDIAKVATVVAID